MVGLIIRRRKKLTEVWVVGGEMMEFCAGEEPLMPAFTIIADTLSRIPPPSIVVVVYTEAI